MTPPTRAASASPRVPSMLWVILSRIPVNNPPKGSDELEPPFVEVGVNRTIS